MQTAADVAQVMGTLAVSAEWGVELDPSFTCTTPTAGDESTIDTWSIEVFDCPYRHRFQDRLMQPSVVTVHPWHPTASAPTLTLAFAANAFSREAAVRCLRPGSCPLTDPSDRPGPCLQLIQRM